MSVDSLILSFCNYDYIELAIHWINSLKELNVNNYLIISTDNKTFDSLKSKNIKTELFIYNNAQSFWEYRINVINEYLKREFNIIHSDLDAIWKKNIISELNNDKIDIYFSQGTTFPREALTKHGFVLCCGFFYVKSKQQTINFFKQYIDKLKEINDDQVAINHLLLDTKWNIPNKFLIKQDKKYKYFEEDIYGHNTKHNLNICLISMLKIQREYFNDTGCIYHILTPKICNQKIKLFKSLGLIK